MTGDIALLVNPTSGKGRGARVGMRALAALRRHGVEARLLVGRDAADALDLGRQAVADGAQALVVVGGDGMVHIGTQLVAGTKTPLGIVPAGSGNDFARVLDLPVLDVEAAARAVVTGTIREVDAARAGSQWYAGVMAAGFDSRVNARANRMTWPRGRLRYDLAVLLELPVFRPIPFTLELDGVTERVDAMLVAVGNSPAYGGGMRICPGAEVDDGLLDVTLVGQVSKATLVRIFPRVYSGRHIDHPAVRTMRARTVSLAAPGVTTYADGERLADLPLTVEAVPGALRVLVPPGAA